MIIKDSMGNEVDLSHANNIMRGMVFRDAGGVVFVVGEQVRSGEWQSAEPEWSSTRAAVSAWRHKDAFLGCDPEHAARASCERFGIAPDIDAGAHGFARTRDGFAVDLRRVALRGVVIGHGEGKRFSPTHRQPVSLGSGQRFVGLDGRHARSEDVERLCCGERETADRWDAERGEYLPARPGGRARNGPDSHRCGRAAPRAWLASPPSTLESLHSSSTKITR